LRDWGLERRQRKGWPHSRAERRGLWTDEQLEAVVKADLI